MSDQKTSALTARETELAVLAWRAIKDVQIDYEKLAEVAGFKSANSARACFGATKKKLLAENNTISPATPSGDRGKRAGVDHGNDNPTPTKKPRASRTKKAQAPAKELSPVDDLDV
ncbi:hypothetical protein M406DRAFT_68002 [Cryphonectria parasitica EP155]|uniref:Uncharacterized protein n=1 Tax=Cryphonectria parasitica (strain ATCC 38755 / EP155) TaxID=660469 RepID=A0A9P5CPV5_CRYP1|nr:uncharacterized protein M406DRAFT_68002 [Cryphonectria parasitica EP155]KAF3765576.1 hypothetical protein M406DRAFT_68002 [Cryphonectria parasitica EP155]